MTRVKKAAKPRRYPRMFGVRIRPGSEPYLGASSSWAANAALDAGAWTASLDWTRERTGKSAGLTRRCRRAQQWPSPE